MRDLKQGRALATRSRIGGEAARHFVLKGYHDTKLEEVFTGAQVTTGAFFHHLTSKEDFGFAVINSHMDPAFGYGRAGSRSGMKYMTLCLAVYLRKKRRCDG